MPTKELILVVIAVLGLANVYLGLARYRNPISHAEDLEAAERSEKVTPIPAPTAASLQKARRLGIMGVVIGAVMTLVAGGFLLALRA